MELWRHVVDAVDINEHLKECVNTARKLVWGYAASICIIKTIDKVTQAKVYGNLLRADVIEYKHEYANHCIQRQTSACLAFKALCVIV